MKKFLCITLVLLQQALSASPSIVFVHIGKEIPAYTETAVRQARLFNKHCDIYLVANEEAISQAADRYRDLPLQLIPCESLNKTAEHHTFIERSKLESGFWSHATERFLYLHDFITQYHLKDVFHLENDNMLYVDVETILPTCKQHYAEIGGTFDNDERFIGGMVYIHNTSSLQPLTSFLTAHAHEGRNEMEVIAQFKKEEGRSKIDHLPIIMSQYVDTHTLVSPAGHKAHDPNLYCNHIAEFDSIFDAAAIGQYLGGIVPINGRSVPGFINESCVFNPSLLTYTWQRDAEGRRVPYAMYEGQKYRINNLHIHSKRLYEYDSKSEERGSSYPYVSGDTFRAAADFVIDEMHLPFSPEKVQPGNTIFVKVDYVDHFFREIHPQINSRYILITHNGDLGIPDSWAHMLDDDKLIAWFGQNSDSYIHPKLHPIPIGIANRCWEHGDVQTFALMQKRLGSLAKKRLLYMNFTIGNHVQERSMVYNMFADKPFCLASPPQEPKVLFNRNTLIQICAKSTR